MDVNLRKCNAVWNEVEDAILKWIRTNKIARMAISKVDYDNLQRTYGPYTWRDNDGKEEILSRREYRGRVLKKLFLEGSLSQQGRRDQLQAINDKLPANKQLPSLLKNLFLERYALADIVARFGEVDMDASGLLGEGQEEAESNRAVEDSTSTPVDTSDVSDSTEATQKEGSIIAGETKEMSDTEEVAAMEELRKRVNVINGMIEQIRLVKAKSWSQLDGDGRSLSKNENFRALGYRHAGQIDPLFPYEDIERLASHVQETPHAGALQWI